MAPSLQTTYVDFKPSELQQAAIERIQYFQKKLRSEYGMYVRSGIELEFLVRDDKGVLQPVSVVNMDNALKYLQDKEQLANAERLKPDSDQLEIIVADKIPAPDGPNSVQNFSPVNIAAATEQLKTRSLQRMLQETSYLNSGGHYSPVCEALAFRNAHPDSPKNLENLTSALHINVSLYNKKGENLFAGMPELAQHCAHSLITLQDEAGLSMLPKPESMERLGKNVWAPAGIGMEDTHFLGRKGNYASINIREAPTEVLKTGTDPATYRHYDRIENRLPGADADPFVSMAVTMAALVDAVETNVSKTKKANGYKLTVAQPAYDANVRHEIPKTHKELGDKFASVQHEKHLKDLLGDRLYRGIQQEYAPHTLAL